MKTFRYFFLGSFALLLGVLSVSLQPTDANAVSPFDDYVFTTDKLLLSNKNTYGIPASSSDDYSLSWYSLVQEYCDPINDTIDFEGAYMVLQNFDLQLDRQDNSILVYWDNRPATDKKITWDSYSIYRELSVPVQYSFHIYLTGDGAEDIGCNFATVNSQRLVANQNSNEPDVQGTSIFLSTYDVNYPEGYEGQPIRDTFTPPEVSDEKPNWSISRLITYQLTVHDLNFNTFDPSLFTCDDELAPIIHYTLSSYSDGASGINMSGTQSSTVQFDFDLTGATPGKYRLAGKYECNEPTNFTQTAEIFFQIDVNGNQSFNAFTDCFIETFPFIDFQGCIDNMLVVINIMGVKIPSTLAALGEVPPGECHTLTVLNHWLSLPNPTVCKQVPSNVRSIITPFVTFALGLMTIKFLAQRRRDDL